MASDGFPEALIFKQNHAIFHRNPSCGVLSRTGRDSLSGDYKETSAEPLPITQNPTGSVSTLPLALVAEPLREGVKKVTKPLSPKQVRFTL